MTSTTVCILFKKIKKTNQKKKNPNNDNNTKDKATKQSIFKAVGKSKIKLYD